MSAYPRASNFTPPPRLPEPLHLKGTVLESDPSGSSQVRAPAPEKDEKQRCTGLLIHVERRLQAVLIRSPNNYYLPDKPLLSWQ